ncbi:MAG: TIGR02206 family membrane protein [Verrucomicrobiales bacterium]|nr:TIGR02206 family membrane protein [Verrucomicrobiales bacterium]MDA7680997.1 TIGR02206 family membrane protein [Verrucomicrobiales bacterium]|tara:strand:+ start:136 stop:867 length:732 start_codon:yes stop_codon:yes gene_type:complete
MTEPIISEFNKFLRLFDGLHLWALFISIGFIILIPLVGRKLPENKKYIGVWVLVSFTIIQEIFDYYNRTSFRELNLARDLPLNICSYSLIIALASLITRNKFCFEFSYFIGVTAGLQSLLTPGISYIYNQTEYILFFMHHSLMVILPLWNVFVDGITTSKYAIFRTMLFLNLMVIPVGVINWLTQSNYMYVCEKPVNDSPFIVGDWPWYMLGLQMAGIIMMLIAAIPMIIANKARALKKLKEL